MLSASTGLALLTGVRPGGATSSRCCRAGCWPPRDGPLAGGGDDRGDAGVPAAQSGLASGLLNTSRLLGGALGLAVLGTVADSHTAQQLRAAVPALSALTDGYALAFAVGALFCLAGAVASVVLLRPSRRVPLAEPAAQNDG